MMINIYSLTEYNFPLIIVGIYYKQVEKIYKAKDFTIQISYVMKNV
jgi:hypothetical protein